MRSGAVILGIVVSAILLAAAGALYVLASNNNGQHYRQTIDLVRQIQLVSSEWSMEITRVRSNPFADFDSLAAFIPRMARLKEDLSDTAQRVPGLPDRLASDIQAYVNAVEAKEERVERFKTGYAVVRNSKRYLPLAATNVLREAQDYQGRCPGSQRLEPDPRCEPVRGAAHRHFPVSADRRDEEASGSQCRLPAVPRQSVGQSSFACRGARRQAGPHGRPLREGDVQPDLRPYGSADRQPRIRARQEDGARHLLRAWQPGCGRTARPVLDLAGDTAESAERTGDSGGRVSAFPALAGCRPRPYFAGP